MQLHFSSEAHNINNILHVSDGTFSFYDALAISLNSVFADSVYDFTEKNNLRQNHLSKTYYILDFDKFTLPNDIYNPEEKIKYHKQKFIPKLPNTMIEDIKRFVTLFVIAPAIFSRKSKRDKATTIVSITKNLIKFIYFILTKNRFIKYISDIEINDIQDALQEYPYKTSELQAHLSYLCNPHVSRNLKYGKLKFNENDIKNIRWQRKKSSVPYTSITDDLFKFLTTTSFEFISSFLDALNINRVDSTNINIETNSYYKEVRQYINPDSFEEYISYRTLIKKNDYRAYYNTAHMFEKRFGFGLNKVHEVLYLVQSAAQYIIELTAMRYSEFSNIQKGCLVNENGQWLINSTLIKNVPIDAKIKNDKWATFSFAIDAINVLEEISKCNFNSFLFSNFFTVKIGVKEEKLTSSGLNYRLNSYLKKIDKESKFSGQTIHSHQLRHTITEQLQIIGVNLEYITLHLKHTYNSFDYSASKVTGGYGNYQNNIVKGITGLKHTTSNKLEGSLENINKYGNKEVENYLTDDNIFKGQVLTDKQSEKYFDKLKKSGVIPIPVGIGFCTRDFNDTKSLQADKPPCISDLQCKTNCKSKVITQRIIPTINCIMDDFDIKLADQSYFHLRGYYQEEKRKLISILNNLKSLGDISND